MLASIHLASLIQKVPSFTSEFGTITQVDAGELPVLERLSLRRLLLVPRGVREPHWHANANELGYCLKGRHLVTIAGSHSARDSFPFTLQDPLIVPRLNPVDPSLKV